MPSLSMKQERHESLLSHYLYVKNLAADDSAARCVDIDLRN